MKSFFKLLLLITCLLLLPVIAFAQDATLPQVVDLGGGYSISLPLAWTLLRGGGVITARGSGLTLKIFTPTHIDSLNTDINADTNVVDALLTLYALPPTTVALAKTDVQKTRYGDRLAGVYTDESDASTDQMAVVIAMPSGSPGYLLFSADKDALPTLQDTITPIVTSFTQTTSAQTDASTPEPAPTRQGASIGGRSTNSSTNTGGASEVNCTVSADAADAAQLRVGPGTNRGAISFLPANVTVTVTGRIVLDNGSIWYQLDKKEAAPKGTSAAELWVSADNVSASGDCDHVGETSAPPVIPGNVAPPTAVPGSANQTPPDQGGANATPGSLPAQGAWVLVMNATTNASCEGGDNFPFASTEIFTPTTYGDTLVGINNASFNYGGNIFNRILNTNSFNGTFIYSDGTPGYVRFNLVSATQMTGSITVNYDIQEHKCSETVQFVSNHG